MGVLAVSLDGVGVVVVGGGCAGGCGAAGLGDEDCCAAVGHFLF